MFTTLIHNNLIIKRIHSTYNQWDYIVNLACLSLYNQSIRPLHPSITSPSVFFSQTSCGKTLQWELVSCERQHTMMTRGATRSSHTPCLIRRQRTCTSVPVLAGFTSVNPFHRPVCLQLHESEDWSQAQWWSQVWGAETLFSVFKDCENALLSQHGPLFSCLPFFILSSLSLATFPYKIKD